MAGHWYPTWADFEHQYSFVLDGRGNHLCYGAGSFGTVWAIQPHAHVQDVESPLCVKVILVDPTAAAGYHDVENIMDREFFLPQEIVSSNREEFEILDGDIIPAFPVSGKVHIIRVHSAYVVEDEAGVTYALIVMEASPYAKPFPVPFKGGLPDRLAAAAISKDGATAGAELFAMMGRLETLDVLFVMRQLLTLMRFLHVDEGGRRYIHRDLKLNNAIIWQIAPYAGRNWIIIKVIDFGLARSAAEEMTVFPREAALCRYRAPELSAGASYNEKVDVFAAGCAFFALISGCHPRANPEGFPRHFRVVRSDESKALDAFYHDAAHDHINDLGKFLADMTEKDPALRLDARALLAKYDWLLPSIPI